MTDRPLVLIGAGRMGSALVEGWLTDGAAARLVVVEPNPAERLQALAEDGRIVLNPAPEPAGLLALCVKPQVFPDVAGTLRAWIGPDTTVLSIMAGIRLGQIASRLGTARVVRAMPNTPGAIGHGVTLLAAGPDADAAMLDLVRARLAPLGRVEGPMSEADLSMATAISGCGPAYLFLLAEILGEAGAKAGLDPALSARIAEATVTGAAALMEASGETPDALRRAVTSPNGVTQAALEVLMAADQWPSSMQAAVAAAIARDAALSAALEEEAGDADRGQPAADRAPGPRHDP